MFNICFLTSISIHALRVEGDPVPLLWSCRTSDFYPRPPGGGRHCIYRIRRRRLGISIHALRVEGDNNFFVILRPCHGISIHALRVEGDTIADILFSIIRNFYPRPPGGGRPLTIMSTARRN